jgi:GntR family transcriptional regulator
MGGSWAGIPGVATVPGVVYEIDRRSEMPSYRQLADMLRADIEAGRIEPDAALPSLTRLVQETGLDVKTVRKAIAVLTGDGLAYIVPGRGTFAGQR